ncbi:MAG: hypothetical protein JO368_09790 [Acidimicrobiales bacterium]|nr:hypothetical protein [Acidimicrobiales bacterium]
MTPNPGSPWQAFPAAVSQPYVASLRRNLRHLGGTSANTNIAAARWKWVNGDHNLLITLVASTSLARIRLQNPIGDAADLCESAGGTPTGSPMAIPGIPISASGSCSLRRGSQASAATVGAFVRGNVAVLVQTTSRSNPLVGAAANEVAADQQYAELPAGGVPLSGGGVDLGWLAVWVVLIGMIVAVTARSARRSGSWRGPLDAIGAAFRRRKVALGVSLAAVVGAMAFTMFDSTVMRGFGEWWGVASFGDFWQNWADAAHTTIAGGYGHLYVLDRTLETAPALQVMSAPIARLAFGLHFPYPSAVLYPTAFWVAGPLFLGTMALPICAADRWLIGMGVTDLRRRLTVLGVMGITLPPIALSGHPEGLVALGAVLYGIAAAFDGRPRATGWWLGFALAFQPFAVLGVPIALIFLKRRDWLTALVPMILVPLAILIVPLASEPNVTLRQLVHQKVYDVFGYISPTWNLDPGVAAYIRAGVALAAIPAAILLARFLPTSRRQGAALVVWTVALLFALRIFEPELFPYFMAPSLALFPISASRLPWWRLAAVCLLSVWLNYWLHVAVRAEWSLWLLLFAQVCLLGGLAFPGRATTRSTAGRPPPARRSVPRVLASR